MTLLQGIFRGGFVKLLCGLDGKSKVIVMFIVSLTLKTRILTQRLNVERGDWQCEHRETNSYEILRECEETLIR